MVLQVLLHHLLGDVPRAPRSVAHCPEMLAPVAFLQMGELLLQQPRRSSLDALHQVAHRQRGRIFNVHVDVVFTHHPFEYPYVLGVTHLHDQVFAAHL